MAAKVLSDYSQFDDKDLVQKALLIREAILKHLSEGDTAYKLLGVKFRKMIYPAHIKKPSIYSKPEYDTKSIKSLEQLTGNQKAYYGNLINLTTLKNIKDLVYSFNVIPNGEDETGESKILMLMSKSKDSLGRVVLDKQGVVFRKFTEEEKLEYQAKLEAEEAADFTGCSSDDAAFAGMDF